MSIKKMSAFSDEEIENMHHKTSTKKPAANHNKATNSVENKTTESKKHGPDGIHAVRGMSLMINKMLLEGKHTPEEIIKTIQPYTRDNSEKQAKVKLTSHLKNIQNHGAVVEILEGNKLSCQDVVLPTTKEPVQNNSQETASE